jgi:hypothetical protein
MRTFGARLVLCVAAVFGLSMSVPVAHAGLLEWEAAVADGTLAGYVNTNIFAPIVADIGTYQEASGVTYEFVLNATNDGVSSALIGTADVAATGDRSGLKWEQWADTGTYGATDFGVADYDSGVANSPDVDTHVVFVNDGLSTAIWVNGLLAGSIGSTPTLSGQVGIGQVYSPAGSFDPLTGTIYGVAIYDDALTGAEIAAHFDAFSAVPEPSAGVIALIALTSLAFVARRK